MGEGKRLAVVLMVEGGEGWLENQRWDGPRAQ